MLAAPLFGGGRTSITTVGLPPLTDLGPSLYEGYAGGLYPGGANALPAAHRAAGEAALARVTPRDAAGQPSPDGLIVVATVGISNAEQAFGLLGELLEGALAERVRFVNLAQGGMHAAPWADPASTAWTEARRRLTAANLAAPQVQVVRAYHAIAHSVYPVQDWPASPRDFQAQAEAAARVTHAEFPHTALAFWGCREYGGYVTTANSPEPYAYRNAWGVKWVIEQQVNGTGLPFSAAGEPAEYPWMAWGPYTWADGLQPRADGLVWEARDFQSDGVHPRKRGRIKLAWAWHEFLRAEPLTAWMFAEAPGPAVALIAPEDNVELPTGAVVAVEAFADGRDTPLDRVEFRRGETVLGTVRQAPWTWVWTDAPADRHELTAVAFDTLGRSRATPVHVLRPAAGGPLELALADDSFESGDFVGGLGWAAQGWTIVGGAQLVTSGGPPDGLYQAQIRGGGGLERPLAAIAESSTLQFQWRGDMTAGTFAVERAEGAGLTTLFTTAGQAVNTVQTVRLALGPWPEGARLRFRVNGPTNISAFVDHIQVLVPAPPGYVAPPPALEALPDGLFRLTRTVQRGRTHLVEHSPDLGPWTTVTAHTAQEDGTAVEILAAPPTGAAAFWRVGEYP